MWCKQLFGYREGLESLDLPMRRSDHGCVGTPQNVIGAEAVEQVHKEDRIPRRIRPHHPGQAAELSIDIFDLGRLGLTGELGFPRKSAVEGDKVEVGKSGGRSGRIRIKLGREFLQLLETSVRGGFRCRWTAFRCQLSERQRRVLFTQLGDLLQPGR